MEQVDSLKTDKKFKKTEIGEIPVDWETKSLSDVADFKNGHAFYVDGYSNEGKKVIDMLNITLEGELDTNPDHFKYVSLQVYEKYKDFHLNKNELVIVMTDINPKLFLLGKTAIIDKNDEYVLNQRVGRLRLQEDKINLRYLHYYTNSSVFLKQIHFLVNGTAQFYVNTPDIVGAKIAAPPLPEQKKIAEILSTVDETIAKNNGIIEKTKELKKGLMQELLTRGIEHKKFKKTKIGEIPVEWEVVHLNDILTVLKNGTTKKQNTLGIGYPVTRIETISSGIIDYKKVGYVEDTANLADYKLQQGDILLSHINSIKHIGKIARFDSGIELYHGMNLLLLRFKKKIDSLYVYYVLSLESAKKYFETHAKPAVNQASLNQKEIGNFILSLATLPEQKKIAKILSAVDEDIERAVDNKKKLETIKKGLMQVLLTGKKRIKV